MSSLRCPRCSSQVEIGRDPKPHCGVCNFPYRDSRRTRDTQSSEPAPPTWAPVVDTPPGRPIGVTAVGLLVVLGGGAAVAFGFRAAGAAVPVLTAVLPVLRVFRVSMAATGLVVGGAVITQGVAILRGAPPAWMFQMAFLLASLLSDAAHIAGGATPLLVSRLAFCSLIGAYFLTPAVRRWFGMSPISVPAFHRPRGTANSTP